MGYVYYLPFRPPMPGAMPRSGLVSMEDFGDKRETPIGIDAWGKVIYNRKLTDDEVYDYELNYGGMTDEI